MEKLRQCRVDSVTSVKTAKGILTDDIPVRFIQWVLGTRFIIMFIQGSFRPVNNCHFEKQRHVFPEI